MRLQQPRWTVVQHSGFAYAGNQEFITGLEEASLNTDAEVNRVKQAGGIVFDNYSMAMDYAEKESYPEEYGGLLPLAPGTFSRSQIDGRRIYIPRGEEHHEATT